MLFSPLNQKSLLLPMPLFPHFATLFSVPFISYFSCLFFLCSFFFIEHFLFCSYIMIARQLARAINKVN